MRSSISARCMTTVVRMCFVSLSSFRFLSEVVCVSGAVRCGAVWVRVRCGCAVLCGRVLRGCWRKIFSWWVNASDGFVLRLSADFFQFNNATNLVAAYACIYWAKHLKDVNLRAFNAGKGNFFYGSAAHCLIGQNRMNGLTSAISPCSSFNPRYCATSPAF